jgi:hypothetical protein
LPECKHESLEFVGEQKTDDGVNVYRRCTSCGSLFVLTPSRKLLRIPGVNPAQLTPQKRDEGF